MNTGTCIACVIDTISGSAQWGIHKQTEEFDKAIISLRATQRTVTVNHVPEISVALDVVLLAINNYW